MMAISKGSARPSAFHSLIKAGARFTCEMPVSTFTPNDFRRYSRQGCLGDGVVRYRLPEDKTLQPCSSEVVCFFIFLDMGLSSKLSLSL